MTNQSKQNKNYKRNIYVFLKIFVCKKIFAAMGHHVQEKYLAEANVQPFQSNPESATGGIL